MPELPEVETIIRDLNKILPGLKIRDVWSDWKKMIKAPKNFEEFRNKLLAKKILKIRRRGKNILIDLSGGLTLLIHQKMTGHLLFGKYRTKTQNSKFKAQSHNLKLKADQKNTEWEAAEKGPLKDDPQNRFIHLVISFTNGKQLVLSDLRKFAKVMLVETKELENLEEIKNLGPEPLAQNFTAVQFTDLIKTKSGKIKQVLMNQKIIAGIGNIYSDEILWEAGIHPLKKTGELNENELKKIYKAIKKVLVKAIKAKGDSMSDYRRPSGEKGGYQKIQNAYQMTGKKCKKGDGGVIKRIKLGGRSAHFCPVHQKV